MDNAAQVPASFQRGDRAAFEKLFATYHRLVYGIAFRMLGDAPTAEDVTQAVFLNVWSSPQSFGGGNFGAWISRVTRNRALDVLRGRARRETLEVPADLPDKQEPDEEVFAKINAERLRSALATLAPEQREMITMGFFGGYTHAEISRRTQTPLGTVKARIRAGLHKLRTALETNA